MVTWSLFLIKLYTIQDVTDVCVVLMCRVQLCEWDDVKCAWLFISWAHQLVTSHDSFSTPLIGYQVLLFMPTDISLFTMKKVYNAHK